MKYETSMKTSDVCLEAEASPRGSLEAENLLPRPLPCLASASSILPRPRPRENCLTYITDEDLLYYSLNRL